MNKSNSTFFLIVLLFCLNSCFSEKFEFIGEKKVTNKEEWLVKFYQLDEFEMFTPVSYEIVKTNGDIVAKRRRLTGADSNLQDVKQFYTKIKDSIFYICYPYPKVVSIKHISNLNKSNQWDLIELLNKYDPSLKK